MPDPGPVPYSMVTRHSSVGEPAEVCGSLGSYSGTLTTVDDVVGSDQSESNRALTT